MRIRCESVHNVLLSICNADGDRAFDEYVVTATFPFVASIQRGGKRAR